MIHTVKKITPLNESINSFFIEFKSAIITKTDSQWNEEDYRGSSIVQWRIMKYYYLLHLMILLSLEIERTIDLQLPWSYYSDKFKLEDNKKCFACDNISIEKAYKAFGIDNYDIEGIELQEIEINNIVGSSDLTKSFKTIKELYLEPNNCINYIEEQLVPQGEFVNAGCDDFNIIEDPGPDNDVR